MHGLAIHSAYIGNTSVSKITMTEIDRTVVWDPYFQEGLGQLITLHVLIQSLNSVFTGYFTKETLIPN